MNALNLFGASRKPVNRLVNRDPNNQLDFTDIGSRQRSGLVSMAANIRSARSTGVRGENVKAAMSYERMMKLGSGAAAARLQKNAFSKLAK